MLKKKSKFKFSTREREQSQRQNKVSNLIRLALIDVLQRGKLLHPSLMPSPLTITKISLTKDLQIADCYFLPFNTELSGEEILAALEESRHIIRKMVTTKINLKYSPELRFHYDHGFGIFN